MRRSVDRRPQRIGHERALGHLELERVRRRARRRPSADAIFSTSVGCRNWRTDRLIAMRGGATPAARHAAMRRHALASTHAPSSSMRPVFSATAMNWLGRMSPSSGWFQRTSASTPVMRERREVDARLVDEAELARARRPAAGSLATISDSSARGVQVRREILEVVAPLLLRGVHRRVGGREQAVDVLRVVRVAGDADARRRRAPRSPRDVDRLGEPLEDLAGDDGDVARVLHVVDDDRELVAAQARDDVGLAHAFLDARRDRPQHRVARGVAVRVVHLLEVVEVDVEQRDPRAMALRARERLARTSCRNSARFGSPVSAIVVREEGEPALVLLLARDVREDDDAARRAARRRRARR